MSLEPTTNFIGTDGVDLGKKLITKDYLISVYPSLASEIGVTPELWVWGSSFNGQLGNGAITGDVSTPVTTFAGGTNWKQVNSSAGGSSAIKTDGTLWMWGAGGNGRLGNAATTNVSTPVTTFSGGNNWKQVSSGGSTISAIKTDGTLWTWGLGNNGQLGNAQTALIVSTPVTTFAGGTNWKQVSSGGSNTAAIKTDGTLWIWGSQFLGALGNGVITNTNVSTPVTTFAGGTNWKQVNCSGFNTSAIKTDGTLWSWGINSAGQLGNSNTINTSTPVTTFSGGNNWKQVQCGNEHVAAIKTDGTLWTWGRGTEGQLGNFALTNRSTPVTTFAGGTNWKQVSGGTFKMLAIKTDGTLWAWGQGLDGAMGNGTTTGNFSTPITTFVGGSNWKQVSTSGSTADTYVLAIKSVDFI